MRLDLLNAVMKLNLIIISLNNAFICIFYILKFEFIRVRLNLEISNIIYTCLRGRDEKLLVWHIYVGHIFRFVHVLPYKFLSSFKLICKPMVRYIVLRILTQSSQLFYLAWEWWATSTLWFNFRYSANSINIKISLTQTGQDNGRCALQ